MRRAGMPDDDSDSGRVAVAGCRFVILAPRHSSKQDAEVCMAAIITLIQSQLRLLLYMVME